jgi:hypothetical protein
MGFKRIASYSKRNASSKKRKHTALKAIEANFNDPAIEKAIRRMPTKKKRRSQLPHCLRSQEVGSQKLPSMSKKTNTNILKGLGVILGQRSKISPETYANELLFAGSSYYKLHQVQPNTSKQVSQAIYSLASSKTASDQSGRSLLCPLLSNPSYYQ